MIQKYREFIRPVGVQAFFLYITGMGLVLIANVSKFKNSKASGRLSGEPTYDDITYFLDGKWRVQEFSQSLFNGFNSFIFNPPHAPFVTFFSTFTQSIHENSSDFIYILNGVLISTLLIILFRLVFNSFLSALLTSGVILCSPISPILFYNFRPDIHYALFLGIAYAYVLSRKSKNRFQNLPLFIVALFLTKPTFVAFTLFNALILLFFCIQENRFTSESKRQFLRGIFLSLILFSWYIPRGLSDITRYVFENTTGKNKDLWVSGTVWSNLESNYGLLARMMTFPFSVMLFLLYFLAGSLLLRKAATRKYALVIILAVVGNSLIAALSRIANPFFYLTSLVLGILLIAIWLESISDKQLSQWREKLVVCSLLSTILINIPAFEWSATVIKSTGNSNRLASEIIEQDNLESVVFMVAGALNPDTVQWYLDRTRVDQAQFSSRALEIRDKGGAEVAIEQALVKNDAIVLRKFDQEGFPSDSYQTYMNELITKKVGETWEPKSVGDFTIWTKEN